MIAPLGLGQNLLLVALADFELRSRRHGIGAGGCGASVSGPNAGIAWCFPVCGGAAFPLREY